MADNRDSFTMRVPKTGSAAASERGAFASPRMPISFTGTREVAKDAGFTFVADEKPQHDYALNPSHDDFDMADDQDRRKQGSR